MIALAMHTCRLKVVNNWKQTRLTRMEVCTNSVVIRVLDSTVNAADIYPGSTSIYAALHMICNNAGEDNTPNRHSYNADRCTCL